MWMLLLLGLVYCSRRTLQIGGGAVRCAQHKHCTPSTLCHVQENFGSVEAFLDIVCPAAWMHGHVAPVACIGSSKNKINDFID